jgi:hypothetical protein
LNLGELERDKMPEDDLIKQNSRWVMIRKDFVRAIPYIIIAVLLVGIIYEPISYIQNLKMRYSQRIIELEIKTKEAENQIELLRTMINQNPKSRVKGR